MFGGGNSKGGLTAAASSLSTEYQLHDKRGGLHKKKANSFGL
jgi:hypothetical protein